jgi:hypothetical protein
MGSQISASESRNVSVRCVNMRGNLYRKVADATPHVLVVAPGSPVIKANGIGRLRAFAITMNAVAGVGN